MPLSIGTYTHTCIIQTGDMAGNTHHQEVDSWEYGFGQTCDFCGKPLVTTEDLLAHIYRELTE